MREALIDLRSGYANKFKAYIDAARILENVNEELFLECIKKASGCRLMIEEYDRMIKEHDNQLVK